MIIKHSIVGTKKLNKALAKLSPEINRRVREELIEGGFLIESTAKKSIQKPSSGITYIRKDRPNHVASKPGSAPNTDTGNLVRNIFTEITDKKNSTKVIVRTDVEYGIHLEFGTTNMEARPWLFPAIQKHKRGILKRINQIINNSLKKAGKK